MLKPPSLGPPKFPLQATLLTIITNTITILTLITITISTIIYNAHAQTLAERISREDVRFQTKRIQRKPATYYATTSREYFYCGSTAYKQIVAGIVAEIIAWSGKHICRSESVEQHVGQYVVNI